MFAPPLPPSGSRPTSAAGHHTYAHNPYDLPLSPAPHEIPPSHHHHQQQQRHGRSNSFSWKHELGLPPPPSEIDSFGDSLNHALIPHTPHQHRSRSRSPAPSRTPTRYDLEFGDDGGALEGRDLPTRTSGHMNMVTKHPKLKVEIVLNSTIFEAGGTISGKLELTCTTSQRLRLGEIAVELEAVEQLTSRDHAATQLFLYNRTMFQGESLPPSNAVLPAAPINGYWTARKGRTTFPFSFRLPSSAPSCVSFAGNASLNYGLKATVQTWYNEEKMIVTARREAFVLEKWQDEYDPKYQQPVEAVGDTRLFMGGNGAVWLEAGVTEQLFWGGGQLLVRCGVKNNTKRHLSGIKVSLARRLIFPVGSPDGTHDSPDTVSLEPRITEIVHEQVFKGREYEFGPNEESVCNVAVDIPKDLRTIRKTRLFEVRTFALVSLVLGSFAKDLTVEVPIYVAHTASVQRPAQEDLRDLHPSPPQPHVPHRPHSSMGHSQPHHSHHHHHHRHHQQNHHHPHQQQLPNPHDNLRYQDPRMLEVERLAAERGWSPAPVFDAGRQRVAPSRPASAAPGMIQLPNQQQPFSLSPNGQLEWNPNANNWNASQFMTPATLGSSIPRSVSAAPEMVARNVPRPTSAGPQQQQQQPNAIAWQPPQRAVSASPGPYAHQAGVGLPQPSQQSWSAHSTTAAQPQQGRRASLPMPGPHGSSFSYPIQQAPASPLQSVGEVLPPMPVPMPVPQTQGQQQQDKQPQQASPASAAPAFFAPPIVAGLATIEEDSESQAGTIKTMRNLPTLGKTGTKNANVNSVSRNNIEQFEAMAEAEEDEEEIKRQMVAMGMKPDEAAFSAQSTRPNVSESGARSAAQVNEVKSNQQGPASTHPHQAAMQAERESVSASASSRQTGRSQTSTSTSSSSGRPRASDIFNTAQKAREEGRDPRAERTSSNASSNEQSTDSQMTVRNVQQSVSQASTSKMPATSDQRRTSATSLRRASSSQGIGLEALETKLVRSTTPKISSGSAQVVTLGNVGRREVSSSPLAGTSSGVRDDSARSRKDSALRAAALAREEAERKAAEDEVRAAEERRRRHEADEAARMEAQRREEEHARALKKQHIERQRAAEQARQERIRSEELAKQRAEEEEQRSRQRAREAAEAEAEARAREQSRIEAEQRARAQREREAQEAEERSMQAASRMSSVPPTLPSKTILHNAAPAAQPSVTSPHDRLALQQQAVRRIDGWLSQASSPNASHLEMPGTPTGSVISMLRRHDGDDGVDVGPGDDGHVRFPSRSPSQRVNPLYEGQSSRASRTSVSGGLPKSQTMATLPSPSSHSKALPAAETASASASTSPTSNKVKEEEVPQLSAELRALIDGSDVKPARRAGTALKDHPIARRISATGQVETSTTSSSARERQISLPSWPRPGVPGNSTFAKAPGPSADNVGASHSASAVPAAKRAKELFSAEDKAIVIPSRVEKTLKAPEENTLAAPDKGYDSRSARGGRGGRVTSVAQLWSKIAGDDEDQENANVEPEALTSTLKPQARRTSAPALDFSKKKPATSAASSSNAVAHIAANFAGSSSASKPEALKSVTAPQFLNTSSAGKPVFSSKTALVKEEGADAQPPVKAERRPLPKPKMEPGAVPAPQLVRPTAMRASRQVTPSKEPSETSSTRNARRISTDLLSNFEKPASTLPANQSSGMLDQRSMRDMMSKVAVDSTILEALQRVEPDTAFVDTALSSKMSKLTLPDGTEVKMSGRGTTKPIGEGKLKSLRAVWGS
ncbi:hypothetical protein BCV70DRAFT_163542 [Testicularia cyperi]|uniref:Arrestin C-terminal-like domain-containing protein n=1 Tax=Testicularia cyperi TaxID=1882483 RepID=A0A317XMP2_9BASI|nr:hypothetical protein BCV70DRAFT_163542 [Testicularia cyperi]